MMQMPYCFLFLALLWVSPLWSQDSMRVSDPLMDLHQGVLVLRIKTASKSLQAYRDAGLDKVAKKVASEIAYRNAQLIKGFLNDYRFSDFLAIHFDSTDALLAGRPVSLNDQLQLDTGTLPVGKNIFYAEIAPVKVSVPVSGHRPKMGDSLQYSDVASRGLVLYDAEFRQLSPPMPYYLNLPLKDKFYEKLGGKINQLLWKKLNQQP